MLWWYSELELIRKSESRFLFLAASDFSAEIERGQLQGPVIGVHDTSWLLLLYISTVREREREQVFRVSSSSSSCSSMSHQLTRAKAYAPTVTPLSSTITGCHI